MSATLFERYKEALMRGHLAARQGESELAITCYEEAASYAPERPLPYAAIGAMSLRLGRPLDAVRAYGEALERAPSDPGALAGRAESLAAVARAAEAAAVFDRLAVVLGGLGREVEALEAARRALELAESKARRRELVRFADAVRASGPDEAGRYVLARADDLLEGDASPTTASGSATAATPTPAEAPARPGRRLARSRSHGATWVPVEAEPAAAAAAKQAAAAEPALAAQQAAATEQAAFTGPAATPQPAAIPDQAPEPAAIAAADPEPEAVIPPVRDPEQEPALEFAAAEPAAVGESMPTPEPALEPLPEPDPTDPVALAAAADAAIAAGDPARARLLLVDLARLDAAAGRRDAALDACYRALGVAPDDLTLHLLLVQLYVQGGWRELAAEKLALLERLTELDGDGDALALVRSATRVVTGRRAD